MARNPLPYVVECKSSYPFFEAIAAFNVEEIARDYAGDCAQANPNYEYRVRLPGKKYTGRIHYSNSRNINAADRR